MAFATATLGENFDNDFEVDEEIAIGEIGGECVESPYEDDTDSSSTSSEEEQLPDTDEEEFARDLVGAAPYRFEPLLPEGEQQPRQPMERNENMERLQRLDWCRCGACALMPTVTESVCCQEIPCMQDTMLQAGTPETCITQHEAFESVALCIVVLDVAYIGYSRREQRQVPHRDHERYRYTAYR
ncbi:uncharacterized protein [Apostichopus japonicus]|uniref:uncharacterized protein n=1 Tax=Stichopus japonicus TaxID=307972 RepID=UPI003AB7B000